ncbi:WD repeat and FYVE domain-containing protein 2-like [Babylonia areolata]|uniref:WD repeat and FYVE domain-containing protein 2-like n=1 Tax=Babylonia areolata TaxID=304850 RepID=UPI003FD4C7BF
MNACHVTRHKMAAQINSDREMDGRKPVLVDKIEGCNDTVNMAYLVPKQDVVISVSDDKTLRVWQKRDSGQYWPSIYHVMQSEASCLDFSPETGRLFVGMDNGTISEFVMEDDFNRMTHKRDFTAHQGRLMAVRFSVGCEWVLSCGKDKYFQWHCSETGRRLGGFQAPTWCLCLEFDEQSRSAFVGDYSGQVTVLKLKDTTFDLITTLKGHSGSVRSLAWDAERKLLFSGSFDNGIIVWDIGGKKGSAYELQGHKDKIQSLIYVDGSKQLISASDDGIVGLWDMDTKRTETPEWVEADSCHKCDSPFFWNFRKMWDDKTIGNRQHHCRRCGRAFCNKCTSKRSTIPPMGYEYEVRVCEDCIDLITEEDKTPLASFHDSRHNVLSLRLDLARRMLVTCGKDHIIKIWDLNSLLR